MKAFKLLPRLALICTIVVWAQNPIISFSQAFSLPATTTASGKINLGFFNSGLTLSITASGQISLITGWNTFPNGSLVNPINPVGDLSNYGYVNAGASGYPTVNGGDGINHFAGGGANYDVNAGAYGPAGPLTTDTTSLAAIRFGAVIGTFKPSPVRSDWFLIGSGTSVVVPAGGANLYVAVNDTTYENNSGSYSGNVTIVPEPSTVALAGLSFFALLPKLARLRKK